MGNRPQFQKLLADLKFCSITRNLERGKRLHAEVIESGNQSNTHVATALLNMYAKCGSMQDARQVFDSIKHPTEVSWTALILGYVENGEGLLALDLFYRMKSEGCTPDSVTYVAALKACASLGVKQQCLEWGKKIHSQIGCHSSAYVRTTLISMYAKCGSMTEAHQVFDRIEHPCVASWTSLLLGYVDSGHGLIALDLFSKMKSQGCVPDSVTYVAAIKACTSMAQKQEGARYLEQGKQIHSEIGCRLSLHVRNALINMYAKFGCMVDAHQVFDNIRHPDVVSWNALIMGYAEVGDESAAFDLFYKMKSRGCAPDTITYVAVLKGCASQAATKDRVGKTECLKRGKQIHLEIGSRMTLFLQSTLIDMYAKCHSMPDAHKVFDSITRPDVVSWNALLLGYADNGDGLTALDLFRRMKSRGCTPDPITFVGVFKACALLGAFEFGRKVHAEIDKFDAILVTCLVDFYAKCGSLMEAQQVFDKHSTTRDVSTWTALLAGYCSFGETDAALKSFENMLEAGFRPDVVSFQCILMCCSHAGLIGKAREYLEAMPAKYGLSPSVEHYTCMVDALGRANMLDDAIVLLHRMPCSPDATTWMAVLGASRKWKNVEVGRLAFQSLVSLDEENATAYVLMANICASRGMWEEQAVLLRLREKSRACRMAEQSFWTNEIGEVHALLASG